MNIDIRMVDGQQPYDSVELSKIKDRNLFIDRRKNSNMLLFILAGYKPYLYEAVFSRVKLFSPEGMDVCVISSGLFDKELDRIAKENSWSYLSTMRNCLTLAQNIAILLHPKAEWLFKMDEDIFVTKHSFKTMLDTYCAVHNNDSYNISFVAPLMPLNGYGHVRVLQKLGMTGVYEKMFEKVKYAAISNRMIGYSPEVAKFFWGENGFIPSIDYMDEEFHSQEFKYRACPVRYSIGFILMRRDLWDVMGGWKVPEEGSGMGMDEDQINQFCIMYSFAMIVSENTVVGHFSFGQQNDAMREYYASHKDKFLLRDIHDKTSGQ